MDQPAEQLSPHDSASQSVDGYRLRTPRTGEVSRLGAEGFGPAEIPQTSAKHGSNAHSSESRRR